MLIFALNLTDWLCTVILLQTGRFYEANPLMRQFVGSLSAGFAVKCLFPTLVIAFVSFALRMLDERELHTADRFISFVLVFYLAIDLDHIINFLVLIFQNSP